MCCDDHVVLTTVQVQEQPSAQPLVQGMVAVAHRCLRHQAAQGQGVAQQQLRCRAEPDDLLLEHPRRQPERLAGASHHGTVGRGAAPQKQLYAHDPLVADDGQLCRFPVCRDVDDGDNGRCREVREIHRVAGLVQNQTLR
ncbi:hypothetical protein D9M68_781600 [compost metagenome]